MEITKEWLQKQGAWKEGLQWFLGQRASQLETCVMKLLKEDHSARANGVIVQAMSDTQKVTYAAFAAKQVLHVFEEKRPNDKRPREAIEAALRFADRPTPENRDAATATYDAAAAAASVTGYSVSAKEKMRLKIIRYGLGLLKEPSLAGFTDE